MVIAELLVVLLHAIEPGMREATLTKWLTNEIPDSPAKSVE